MSGYSPTEIVNPKQTLKRREAQAETPSAPASSTPSGDMSQYEFTSGGPKRRKVDEAARNKKFLELMKKQQAPLP